MKEFEEYCKEFVRDNIYDLKELIIDVREIPYYITQGINANGTCTMSTQLAKEYLIHWSWECGDFMDYCRNELGYTINPFNQAEVFMVDMVINGITKMFYQIEEDFDSEIELTEENIEHILNKIEPLTIQF